MRIRGLIQALAFATVVVSMATLIGHRYYLLDILSHFRAQYLLASVIVAVLLVLLRSRRWAAVMFVVTAINSIPVAIWHIGAAEASQAGGSTTKLLLSNVYSGNPDTRHLFDLVALEKPDLVFLQEVTAARSRELGTLRDQYPYSLNIPREDNFGIAVLSRYPFSNARVIESPPYGYPSLVVDVDIDGQHATFVTTHPSPPLDAAGFDARNIQLASIAELLADATGPRVLIGDLNTTMWSAYYEQLVTTTGLVDARHGHGVLPSWPTQLPFAMIPIDHCLVSDGIAVRRVRTGPDIGSDHLPLVVELQFENNGTGQAIR